MLFNNIQICKHSDYLLFSRENGIIQFLIDCFYKKYTVHCNIQDHRIFQQRYKI